MNASASADRRAASWRIAPTEFRGKGEAARAEEVPARLPGLQKVHQVVS